MLGVVRWQRGAVMHQQVSEHVAVAHVPERVKEDLEVSKVDEQRLSQLDHPLHPLVVVVVVTLHIRCHAQEDLDALDARKDQFSNRNHASNEHTAPKLVLLKRLVESLAHGPERLERAHQGE